MCPWAQTATKSKEPRTPLVSAFLLPPFQQCIWKSGSEFGTARQVPAAWPATLAIALLSSAVVHLRQCVAWLQYAWACLGGMIHKGVQSCLVWICMNMSICAHHTCFPLLRETALLATYTKHDPRNQNRSFFCFFWSARRCWRFANLSLKRFLSLSFKVRSKKDSADLPTQPLAKQNHTTCIYMYPHVGTSALQNAWASCFNSCGLTKSMGMFKYSKQTWYQPVSLWVPLDIFGSCDNKKKCWKTHLEPSQVDPSTYGLLIL